MKKYIIKNADGSEQTVMRAIHNSRKEAGESMMNYIRKHNENCDGDKYLSPFDFILEEVECGDINEVISDFESARKALGTKPNADFYVVKRKHSEKVAHLENAARLALLEDVARLVTDINPKHIKALVALNKLFTIAQAWNKEDEFVPNYSDWKQDKWFPWFKYDEDTARFVCVDTIYTPTNMFAYFGSRLCFKTSERAEQFGKQFDDLYNEVFFIKTIE
jgi:hypothetical protein